MIQLSSISRAGVVWALPATVTCMAGCLGYGGPPEPEAPLRVPESYDTDAPESAAATGGSTDSTGEMRWWSEFNDPGLSAMVERGLDQNLDLYAAWTRLERAEAMAWQANAPRYPTVSGEASIGRASSLQSFGTVESSQASLSLPVSYEVDLFARFKAEGEAAGLEAEASRATYESMAITVSAQIAEAWYDLVQARAQRELVEGQLELNETFLELTLLRFRQGLSSGLDVHQQRQQVVAIRGQLESIGAQEEVAAHRLAVLVGENPTGMTPPARAELPKLPDLPDTGVPADLLEQRPDVRAAARRVQAADRRVGAAIAARLPTIRLGATPGWTWIKAEIGGNFGGMGGEQTNTGFVWSVNATLNVPIFDGFQRTSQIHVRRAEVQEAMATYGQTLRQAMVEVENALAQERRQRERIGHLEKRVEVLGDTLEAARDRYRQGLSDFLPVLTALVNQQQAELDLLSGRRQVLSQRIQLHRALGGTWTRELDAPELEEVSQ